MATSLRREDFSGDLKEEHHTQYPLWARLASRNPVIQMRMSRRTETSRLPAARGQHTGVTQESLTLSTTSPCADENKSMVCTTRNYYFSDF